MKLLNLTSMLTLLNGQRERACAGEKEALGGAACLATGEKTFGWEADRVESNWANCGRREAQRNVANPSRDTAAEHWSLWFDLRSTLRLGAVSVEM